MTVTHDHTHAEHRQSFITRWIFSQDHKVIGIQYLMTSLLMAAIGVVIGVIVVLMYLPIFELAGSLQ